MEMKPTKNFRLAISLACLAWGASSATASTVAFTPSGDIYAADIGSSVNLGALFTPSADIVVNALGFYDGAGVVGAETVGLYNSTGTLLTSVSVPITGATVGGYFFASITPVELYKDDQYTIVALTGNNNWNYSSSNYVTAPDVTYDGHRYAYSTSLTFPTGVVVGNGYGSYYGPNFEYAEAAPEPATWLMMGFGFLGLGLSGYRGTRDTKATAV